MHGRHFGDGSMATLDGDRVAATASYHALLQADPELARRSHDALVQAHDRHNIRIQNRLLCNVLRPRFMTASEEQHLAYVSETVATVFERVGELLLSDDRQMDRIGATDQERELWEVDPGFTGITVTSRLDAFVGSARPRFVEYNAESPASIGYIDSLSRIFAELPATQVWGKLPSASSIREPLLQTLLRAYEEFGGTGAPNIAVIDWEAVITRRDFELCAEYFREHGYPTVICDPRALEYRNGKLHLGDQQIDIVYRRVLLHELLEHAEEDADLLQAYRDGAVCIVNSPRSKLLHRKILFAYLSDRSFPIHMTPEEEQVVDETIPWTRALTPGSATYRGETGDLARLLITNQDRFVIKPIDDYGGRGVVLGWEASEEEWRQALEAAMDNDYIAQERVEIPEEDFPVWREGQLEMATLMLDTDPLLFDGHMGGILTRTSGSALLNVSAGSGSTTPTFVLRS